MTTLQDKGLQPVVAQPAQGMGSWRNGARGIVLRDYFAQSALQGILSSRNGPVVFDPRVVEVANQYAQAMLAASISFESLVD